MIKGDRCSPGDQAAGAGLTQGETLYWASKTVGFFQARQPTGRGSSLCEGSGEGGLVKPQHGGLLGNLTPGDTQGTSGWQQSQVGKNRCHGPSLEEGRCVHRQVHVGCKCVGSVKRCHPALLRDASTLPCPSHRVTGDLLMWASRPRCECPSKVCSEAKVSMEELGRPREGDST